jgi:hypothetical protein
MSDVFSDAEERYRFACERRQAIIAAWEAEGRPLVTAGSQGQLVEHPLVKQMHAADRLCQQLGEALRRKQPGPDPVAVVKASVGISPAAKKRSGRRSLRAVS